MFFFKEKKIFFLLFFIVLNISCFNIKWLEMNQSLENEETFVIKCEYDTKNEYILAESLQANTFPTKQYVSILFDKQPDELYVPYKLRPIFVLHGKGVIKFIISSPIETIEKILLFFAKYDFKNQKEGELKELIISSNSVEEKKIEDIQSQKDEIEEYNGDLEKLIEEAENENVDEFSNIENKSDEKSSYIFNLLKDTNNFWKILILIFLIGILMSLTPCMYPMIPITLGILEISESNSKKKNLIKSIFYILGIATTFSILGFLATYGNFMIGSLFQKSWFVFGLLFFLLYMIFGIFDLINLNSFSFAFFKNFSIKNQVGIFLYGMLSGSIFSPCVSPGLFALLTVVSEQKSYFIGTLFLFVFGLGMGFPFLIISYFFQNLNFLPKAGFWMNYIKYSIGLMLIFLWNSYAKLILSENISYSFTIFILLIIFYKFLRKLKNSQNQEKKYIQFFFLILSSLVFYYFYKIYLNNQFVEKKEIEDSFFYDFDEAKEIALEENKFLLVDFTAPWCVYCKKIDKAHFQNEIFFEKISEFIIPVKITLKEENNQNIKDLIKFFEIKGLPVILILNPKNNEIIKKYDSSVLEITTENFVKDILYGLNENL